jgi:hypothetical protein
VLHGSVYVSGPRAEWNGLEVAAVYAFFAAALFALWRITAFANRRTPLVAPLAITLSLQSAGVLMFLALYLGGGKAALPIGGALFGTTLAGLLRTDPSARAHADALLGPAMVSLAGLVVVGRFFSRVGTTEAIVVATAPLLCLLGELPPIARRKPWLVASVKLLLTAAPLATVLYLAKQAFDRDAPPM